MAEENQFTEAGKAGRQFRSALSSAYGATKSGVKALGRGAKAGYDYINDVVTEYGQEPLLNLYPQSVNLAAKATEFGAGVIGIPTSQGRYPYYNLPTRFDKQTPVAEVFENEQQTEIPSIPLKKPYAKPNLWRVMLEGSDPSKDLFADTEDEAKYLLKTLQDKGEKGVIAGIRIAPKDRNDKEEEERLKAEYIKRAETKGKSDIPQESPIVTEKRKKYLENLERLRSGREAREAAAKKRDEENRQRFERFTSGAGRSKFASDVAARQASEDQVNQYNRQLSTLKKAYRNAGRNQDYAGQFKLGKLLDAYEAGIPKEMGARQKAARQGIISKRNQELEEKFRRARDARAAQERVNMTNPDAAQFSEYTESEYY